MPEPSSCLQECRDLYAAIMARVKGTQEQSVGHKGRTLAYAETSLKDMIGIYRQLRDACPEAQAELPALNDPDKPGGRRGGPASFISQHWR